MGKNSNKEGTVELWGHEFKKVKNGLDEEQVASFVNKLMNEHEALLKRAEHLSSLTKLAEKTVVEAENVAKQLQKEAEDRAKDEAKAIIAKAEEQAQQVVQEKNAEAVAMANREAEAVKAKAQQQAELLLEERAKRIQPELRDIAKRLYGELLAQVESLKQQVVASEEEFDHKLSQPLPQTSNVSMEADELDHELLELAPPIDETNAGEPDWELEISPPLDLTQILDIMNHLDSLPEITNTELIPRVDSPSITVFVREPIDLINKLRSLPQVAEVTEDTTESANGQDRPGKVQIVLSEKPHNNKTAE
jgi:cell division septum initiation protein DivIVA